MITLNLRGLTRGGRIGPQVLGHQGPRFVIDHSDVPHVEDGTGLTVCPIDCVFTGKDNVFIVFGVPNVALVLPNETGTGWNRLAAFMFWRSPTFVGNTKGRVQAGVFYELLGLPPEAIEALQQASASLVGTRKASCAHTVALALHQAGFTANGKSLHRIYRPSRLASILWRNGLQFKDQPIELRIIQTDKSVPDHFVSVWKREASSVLRLIKKYVFKSDHVTAPVFDPGMESIEMSGDVWETPGPRTDIGVSLASNTGVNLSYLLGEQPEFVAKLPAPIVSDYLQEPLMSFPGTLDRVTKIKKYVLFSRPVIWFMRKHLVAKIEWFRDVPAAASAVMLRRSPGIDRNEAFVYNFVLTGTEMKIKRLLNDNGRDQKFVNWMLAKHVLLSGYSQDVRLAGELWCHEDENGLLTVYISGESGTYQPDPERAQAAAELLGKMFNVNSVVVSRRA